MKTAKPQNAADRVEQDVTAATSAIRRLAVEAMAGNLHAHRMLVAIAAGTNAEVRLLSGAQFANASTVARSCTSWPMNVDNHPEIQKRNLRWLGLLPIGEESGWKKPNARKPYSFKTTANATLSAVMAKIGSDAVMASRPIPKITFRMVWAEVMASNAGCPEGNKELRTLGLYNAQKTIDSYPEGTGTFEHRVRQGIRERLKEAFSKITTLAQE